MSLISVRKLSVHYGDVTAVDNVSFAIAAGESVGLVGRSGSGKSQTALAIMGLTDLAAAVHGEIDFGGQELLGLSEQERRRYRATGIAMVFQDPALALNPYLTVGSQLRRILLAHKLENDANADKRVLKMLDRVGLPDALRQARSYPHELSGGMRQRVMIASALIAKPALLIADEPTTALDVTVQAQILELLDDIRGDTSLLLITHDLGIVATHCDRMLVLERGRLIEEGSTVRLFAGATHAHTRELLRTATRIVVDRHIDSDEPGQADVDRHNVPDVDRHQTDMDRHDQPDVDRHSDGEDFRLLAKRVCVTYGELRAVKSADLAVKRGETVAIVGESGSGKTSLARAMIGLVEGQGELTINGISTPFATYRRSLELKRAVQLVFQDPVGSLNPQHRVQDIVEEPLKQHDKAIKSSERRQKVRSALKGVSLDPDIMKRFPHQLSGGQAQRVAIARALITSPEILICDEAAAALDGPVREEVLQLLMKLQAQTGLSIVFISHDLGLVSRIAHRVIVMYLGTVVEEAETTQLFTDPQHPYTRALIDAVPVPDPAYRPRPALSGEVPSVLAPPSGCGFHPRCAYAVTACKERSPVLETVAHAKVRCHRAEEIDLADGLPDYGVRESAVATALDRDAPQ